MDQLLTSGVQNETCELRLEEIKQQSPNPRMMQYEEHKRQVGELKGMEMGERIAEQ
jgi:hypothetical protein